jgi:hypothetical protein
MKKLFVWLAWILAFFTAVTVTGVVFADSVITRAINRAGYKVVNVDTRVEDTDLCIRKGILTLNGIELKNPEGFKSPRMIYVERLSLVISPQSLFREKILVKKVEIRGADLTYEAGGFGQSNLSVFVEDLKKQMNRRRLNNGESGRSKKLVTIDHLYVDGGRVTLSAVFSKGKGIILPLPAIDIHDIGKDRKMGISEAVAEVLKKLGRAALAATDEQGGA